MNNILELIGRDAELFEEDVARFEEEMASEIEESRFLVIGGAGSIGQAVVKELFKRHPRLLHVVDISENNMVELVRDIRSSLGYIEGDFRTFALDCGSREFDVFFDQEGSYDYVLNLSALKHVRSEKDPYTLMRMVKVNILNTEKTVAQAHEGGAKKYFCVSTDKATKPVNMMGASKRIMELFLMRWSLEIPISTARFANVAFSDGSLLHGFNQRIQKKQPLSAPHDVKRYFITPKESGELCLMSCIFGQNKDIFFPKLSNKLHLITFADIALRYLRLIGLEPFECETEDEARSGVDELSRKGFWPCYFFASNTTGEKDFEEFYSDHDDLDMDRFFNIGVIRNEATFDRSKLDQFIQSIGKMRNKGSWSKQELVVLFCYMLPEFRHLETGKYLDGKM